MAVPHLCRPQAVWRCGERRSSNPGFRRNDPVQVPVGWSQSIDFRPNSATIDGWNPIRPPDDDDDGHIINMCRRPFDLRRSKAVVSLCFFFAGICYQLSTPKAQSPATAVRSFIWPRLDIIDTKRAAGGRPWPMDRRLFQLIGWKSSTTAMDAVPSRERRDLWPVDRFASVLVHQDSTQ